MPKTLCCSGREHVMSETFMNAPTPLDFGREHPPSSQVSNPQVHEELRRLKSEVHHRLVVGMDLAALSSLNREQLRQEVRRVAEELCQRSSSLLNRQER